MGRQERQTLEEVAMAVAAMAVAAMVVVAMVEDMESRVVAAMAPQTLPMKGWRRHNQEL